MDANGYQIKAARTLISGPGFDVKDGDMMMLWCAIGLAGETGEVCEQLKKGILHQHGMDADRLKKELGDVMWYLAGLCTVAGLDLGDVMQTNIDKLQRRYPNGFSPEDSVARVDTNGRHE